MIGHYKRSKYLAEQAVRELIEREGVPAVIVNPSAPIGPGDARPTPTGRMVLEAARGRMPAYVDTGLNVVTSTTSPRAICWPSSAAGRRALHPGRPEPARSARSWP